MGFFLGLGIFFLQHTGADKFFQEYMEPIFFFTICTIVTFRQLSRFFFLAGLGPVFFGGGASSRARKFFSEKSCPTPAYFMVATLVLAE